MISKSGLFFAFALILLVAILDASFPGGRVFYEGERALSSSTVSNFLFAVAFAVLVISMFLRTLTREHVWNGLVRFSKYFVPIGTVFYLTAAFLSKGRVGLFGMPVFGDPQYWVGITLISIYGLGMLYFSLKTFYQKW